MKNNKEIFFDGCFVISFILAVLSFLFFAFLLFTNIAYVEYVPYWNDYFLFYGKLISLFNNIKITIFVITIICCVLSAFLKNRIMFLINTIFDLISSIIFIKVISDYFYYARKILFNSASILICIMILLVSFLFHLVFALTYEKKYYIGNKKIEENNNDNPY